MPRVWSCNEWDPLEEVVVGNPLGARFPFADPSTRLAEYPDRALDSLPQGVFPDQIIEETEEDLQTFVEALEARGVTVKRPDTWPHEQVIKTPHWECQGYYNYCPRDVLLVIGDTVIETPNVIRGRSLETGSYRRLLMEYLEEGANWFAAPKPMLEDRLFEYDVSAPTPRNIEPAFDAANVLRFGRDLLYLVSATGNELGGRWLQRVLGDEFTVHFMKDVYYGSHIDSTLVALKPGLLLANPARLSPDTVPPFLKQWEILFSPPMENQDRYSAEYLQQAIGSEWIDMNLFSLGPDTVVVDRDQTALIKLLESHQMEVIPLKLRHSRMMGGGFHCVTLDTRRRGKMESYFD